MKKLSLFSILLCSFVVLFILGSCSLTVQNYDSASLEIRLPVSSAASQTRALVSTEGSVYLCLIREDGSFKYFRQSVSGSGKVIFSDVPVGKYTDILVVHTTRNIDTAFKELTFGKGWTRNDIESSLAEVIDGYGSIGWTGTKTLKRGSNDLGPLTLRPLCKTKNTIDLGSKNFTIAKGTQLSCFYQLDFGEEDTAYGENLLYVSANGLIFELYNAEGEKIDRGTNAFWTIPKGTKTVFLLVSGSLSLNGAIISLSLDSYTRYVSADGGGIGLKKDSPISWSNAIDWANANTTNIARTLVLVENIDLEETVEVHAPMVLRSINEKSITNEANTLFSVEDGAKLYLDGITISGNETAEGSLIKVEDGGTLVMRDKSVITSHSGPKQGGGVYVANGGTFTMDGGTIEECFAERGAGVYVALGGEVYLNGGTIEQNVSSLDYGAGLYAEFGASIALGGDKSIGEFVKNNTVDDLQDEFPWQQAFIDAVINYEFDSGDFPKFTDLQQAVGKANSGVPVRFAASGSTPAPLSIIMTSGFELRGNLWLAGGINLYRKDSYKNAFFELTGNASIVLGSVTLSGKSGVNELDPVFDVQEALVVAKNTASIVLVNSTLQDNTGGGLRLEDTATLYVAEYGSINNNSAVQGAGIYLANKSSIVPLGSSFELEVSGNTATLDGDYGYGGIYAEDSMGSWVEAIYEGVSEYVYENNPKNHNLVAVTSIPTATFSEQTIEGKGLCVLLGDEKAVEEEYIWKLNMPTESGTYRIPIVDYYGYPPRSLVVYGNDLETEIPSKTLVYTDNYRTTEIIFSHSGSGEIYLKDECFTKFYIQYDDPNDINFEYLEELRAYGTSYRTSFVVAEKDGNNEKSILSPYDFGGTSGSNSISKTFSVYNLSGVPISIDGSFENASGANSNSKDRFRTENFPLNIPARGKNEFVITFGPNSETVWTDFSVDFTLSANGEEFVLEFSGSHSN